jgi:hypothetical protein
MRGENMEKANKELFEKIIKKTNHKNAESIEEAIYQGHLYIYNTETEYCNDGWEFDSEDNYVVLDDGKVVRLVD